jgi:hypothetical protein
MFEILVTSINSIFNVVSTAALKLSSSVIDNLLKFVYIFCKTKTKTVYWKYQVYIQWCLPQNEKILNPIGKSSEKNWGYDKQTWERCPFWMNFL